METPKAQIQMHVLSVCMCKLLSGAEKMLCSFRVLFFLPMDSLTGLGIKKKVLKG